MKLKKPEIHEDPPPIVMSAGDLFHAFGGIVKSDLEPPLRFAIGYATSSLDYLGRMEPSDNLEKAMKHFNKAIAAIRAYADEHEIELRKSMRT